jgi:hypothetical protein
VDNNCTKYIIYIYNIIYIYICNIIYIFIYYIIYIYMYMIAYPLGDCTEQKPHNKSNHGPFLMSSLGNTVNGVSMAVIGIGTDRDHPNNPFP